MAERAVLGMGSGYDEVPAMLEERKDVKGRARTVVAYTGYYKGAKVSAIAAPGGSIYIEWVVRVLGTRKAKAIIGIGFCGTLQEDVNVGDIVVPIAAARCESTSDAYAPNEMPAVADFEALRLLADFLSSSGFKIHVGSVVTTAAPLRETEGFVRKWSEAGALAVDGECSTLFTVSRFEGIKAGAVLAVSDSPLKCVTHVFDDELNKRCREAYRKIVEAAFEAVARLTE